MVESMTEPTEPEIRKPAPPWMMYLSVILAVIVVFGVVTWALGLGPFAYRQIYYGTSEIYMLNMSDEAVTVTLDGGKPLELVPESADRTPLLGGTTHVITRKKDGTVLEEFDVFVDGAPVFYNVAGAKCLALSDVSSYYRGGDKGIEVLATYGRGTKIIPLPHDNIIWPRQTLRDEVRGGAGVAWIEMVACPLAEVGEENVLAGHLDFLLTERKQREQELKKQAEINRMMMNGDSDGVDKLVKTGGGATLALPDAGVDGGSN
jgi:hypothetical protein